MTTNEKTNQESFKVSGEELLSRIKEIFKEGKAKKVIIGLVLAPKLAAIGAIAAMAEHWTIIIEK